MAKAPRSHGGHPPVHPGKRGAAQNQGVAKLGAILDAFEAFHGAPPELPPRNPFEWILWENVAYLVDESQRSRAFETLKTSVGTQPEAILAASHEALLSVGKLGGMRPLDRARRLRDIAEIALGDDLKGALALPPGDARKALQRFPSIGKPGAEKILLFTGAEAVLALESNGLRVLTRLGFGEDKKSYATTYRSAQQAAEAELPREFRVLIRAHLLLKQHGQVVCKRSVPHCEVCPVAPSCAHYSRQRGT